MGLVIKTDFVADRLADRFAQLFRNTVGDGARGNPPGLGMTNKSCRASAY